MRFRHDRRLFAAVALAAGGMAATGLSGCAAPATPAASSVRLVVFGEQHDQPDQQRQVAEAVRTMAAGGTLAAVVLEMADRGHGTAGLGRDADEAAARQALGWDEAGWPWPAYAGVVMNAVHAGVPVYGGNLPSAQTKTAMADARLDDRIDDGVRARLTEGVRTGHCNMLPESQLPAMVRVQVARDLSIAETVAEQSSLAAPTKQVVLLTGAFHASRDRGVPWHLAEERWIAPERIEVIAFGDGSDLAVDAVRPAVATPQEDHCEAFRKHVPKPPARGAASN